MSSRTVVIDLPEAEAQALEARAARHGLSVAELLRRGLNLDALARRASHEGRLFVREPDGSERRLLILP